jgi:hypothetical protein
MEIVTQTGKQRGDRGPSLARQRSSGDKTMKVIWEACFVCLAIPCAWLLLARLDAWQQSWLARQVTTDDFKQCKACGEWIIIDTEMEHMGFCKRRQNLPQLKTWLLTKHEPNDEELQRLRTEAEELLELEKKHD